MQNVLFGSGIKASSCNNLRFIYVSSVYCTSDQKGYGLLEARAYLSASKAIFEIKKKHKKNAIGSGRRFMKGLNVRHI